MVINYQRATLPEITAYNRLHYYGNRLPVVILARKQKTKRLSRRKEILSDLSKTLFKEKILMNFKKLN